MKKLVFFLFNLGTGTESESFSQLRSQVAIQNKAMDKSTTALECDRDLIKVCAKIVQALASDCELSFV
jgi:hypothetical protein